MIGVANARMYSVDAVTSAAWRALLAHVLSVARAEATIIDHVYPARLDALWARNDLACVLMCGWPYRLEGARKRLLAAPVPVGGTGPVYRAELVVRADSPWWRLEDAFGGRFAFNETHSHSGWNLPRALFAPHAVGRALFSEVVGPFISHRASIEAVLAGRADLASIDGYWLALLRQAEPALTAGLRTLGVTASSPIPLFVASPERPVAESEAVAAALLGLADSDAGRSLLAPLALERFAAVDPETYVATERFAEIAARLGYETIR